MEKTKVVRLSAVKKADPLDIEAEALKARAAKLVQNTKPVSGTLLEVVKKYSNRFTYKGQFTRGAGDVGDSQTKKPKAES